MTIIGLCFLAPIAGAEVFSDDFVSQKQLAILNRTSNQPSTCQVIRIHENWFLTSAHCVKNCETDRCQLRVLLARGKEVSALADISDRDIFISKEYQEGKLAGSVFWDIALLRYRPERYEFKTNDGYLIDRETFEQALRKDSVLRRQWKGAVDPVLPELIVYSGPELMQLDKKDNVIVPRWTDGAMTYYTNPNYVLYAGKRQAMWVTDGFGVTEGNSGGGVWTEQDGGLLGVVSAKQDNQLPTAVKEAYPQLGKTTEFFAFTGFSKKTTWKFVEEVLKQYGDEVKTKKLKKIENFPPTF